MTQSRGRQLIRQLELLKHLCSSNGLGVEELVKTLGVTRRTIYRDLDLLISLGVTIHKQEAGTVVLYSASPSAFQEVMAVTSDVTASNETKINEKNSQKERT